jgi:hypothetical protein
MTWHRQDSAFLAGTVAAGAFVMYMLASNFGLVAAPSPFDVRLGVGDLPDPLIAPAATVIATSRARTIFVVRRVRVVAAQPVETPIPTATPPPVSVVVATPVPTSIAVPAPLKKV